MDGVDFVLVECFKVERPPDKAMAYNPLTEAECGQKNPLGRLASHITRDHAFGEAHGHLFPSSSDQLVEQFLQETRTVPQSFRMDGITFGMTRN